jgi:hypothetical protein
MAKYRIRATVDAYDLNTVLYLVERGFDVGLWASWESYSVHKSLDDAEKAVQTYLAQDRRVAEFNNTLGKKVYG